MMKPLPLAALRAALRPDAVRCLLHANAGSFARSQARTKTRAYALCGPQALSQLACYCLRQAGTDGPATHHAVAGPAPGPRATAETSRHPNPSTDAAHGQLQGRADWPVTATMCALPGRAVAGQLLGFSGFIEVVVAVPTARPAGVYLATVGDGAHVRTTRWLRKP